MSGLTLQSGQHTWLRYNRGIALALPDPDEEWTVADVNFSVETLHTLSSQNLIRKVGTCPEHGERHLWQTKQATHEYIESSIDRLHLAPCGHSGVRCIERGETYTCTNEDCAETFDRETAEKVVR